MLAWDILRVFPGSSIKDLQICRTGALASDFGAVNLWSTTPVHRDELLLGAGTPKSVRPPESEVNPSYRLQFSAGMV